MKEDVNKYRFKDAFAQSGEYKNNFSYNGLDALYDYLIELEESTSVEFELDIIGFCCEYTEYENISEFNDAYGSDYEDWHEVDAVVAVIDNSDGAIVEQI